MGKTNKNPTKAIKDPQDHPISKSKTLLANLNSYIRMLKKHFPNMSSKQYIKNVHRFVDKIKRKLKYTDQSKLFEARQKIKICKKCQGWSSNSSFIQCNQCEDYYHNTCAKNYPPPQQEHWYCQSCDNQNRKKRTDKNQYLRNSSKFDECQKCQRGKFQGQAFVTCIKCNLKYHKTCYGKPNAVCYKCHHQIEKQLKQKTKNKSLFDFQFTKTQSSKKRSNSPAKNQRNDSFKLFGRSLNSSPQNRGYQKPSKYDKDDQTTQAQTNPTPLFKRTYPQMTQQEIQYYTKQLLYAIKAKKMNYSQHLVFEESSLSQNLYEESLNFGLMQMSKIEQQVYDKYQKQPFGPFKFVYKQNMGYDVIADKDLPQHMLICEYVGDVVSHRTVIQKRSQTGQQNDSLFELSIGKDADQTLFICPQKYTNMARFINGVNSKNGKHKINVASVRYFCRGKPGVFLYTTRKIKKGQSLAYEYNSGGYIGYPTDDFV